jgi:anti-sigma regulatory factor (Ser/Thr protein kinase)
LLAVAATGTCEPNGTTDLRERIRGGPTAPATARELIATTLSESTREETLRDALLLATELVTNAVRHANVDEAGTIQLSAVAGDGLLRVAVTDPGGHGTPRMQELSVDVPGGMGLYLVDQISDRWAVEGGDGGATRVWFELAL